MALPVRSLTHFRLSIRLPIGDLKEDARPLMKAYLCCVRWQLRLECLDGCSSGGEQSSRMPAKKRIALDTQQKAAPLRKTSDRIDQCTGAEESHEVLKQGLELQSNGSRASSATRLLE